MDTKQSHRIVIDVDSRGLSVEDIAGRVSSWCVEFTRVEGVDVRCIEVRRSDGADHTSAVPAAAHDCRNTTNHDDTAPGLCFYDPDGCRNPEHYPNPFARSVADALHQSERERQ